MALQLIALGSTAGDGTGDTARVGGAKINANFTEVYAAITTLQQSVVSISYVPSNVAITGGTISGVAITSSPISGSTVSATLIDLPGYRLSESAFFTGGVVPGVKLQNRVANQRSLLAIVPNGSSSTTDIWLFATSDTTGNYSGIAWGYGGSAWGWNTIAAGSGTPYGMYFDASNGQSQATANLVLPTTGGVQIKGHSYIANGAADVGLRLGAASGVGGGVLVLHQSASAPTPASQDGMLFTLAGEVQAMDDSGNISVISPHAKDAPAALYESGPGVDEMLRRANVYLAEVRWWATTRRQVIDRLDRHARTGTHAQSVAAWAEFAAREASGRIDCEAVETFAEYQARTGQSLVPGDQDAAWWLAHTPAERWARVEGERAAKSQAARAAWQARKTAWEAKGGTPTPFSEAEPPVYEARSVPDVFL